MGFESYVTNAKKCGPGKIRVTRRGFNRGGKRVKPTSYCMTDRGRKGRGPKIIPTPRPGSLGGPGYTQKSAEQRHRLLRRHVREHGYASTISALQSRINLGSRTMSTQALDVFERDKRWLQKEHDKVATKRNKKPRTAAQKRATAKMIAANKRKRNKKKAKKRTKKKTTKKKRAKKKTTKKTRKVCTRTKRGRKKCKKVTKKKCAKRKTRKKTKLAKKRAGRALQRGSSAAGRSMGYRSWCRNYMNLNVPEGELDG